MLSKVKKDLNAALNACEKARVIQREIIQLCAQTIRDIQKDKYTKAIHKLKTIEKN